MLCPNCSGEIPEGKKFCGHCGHRLLTGDPVPSSSAPENFDAVAPVSAPLENCSTCDAQNLSGARFCSACGVDLENLSTQAPDPQTEKRPTAVIALTWMSFLSGVDIVGLVVGFGITKRKNWAWWLGIIRIILWLIWFTYLIGNNVWVKVFRVVNNIRVYETKFQTEYLWLFAVVGFMGIQLLQFFTKEVRDYLDR
jgi:uncharacterized membrane protein YvbJ